MSRLIQYSVNEVSVPGLSQEETLASLRQYIEQDPQLRPVRVQRNHDGSIEVTVEVRDD